MRHRLRFLCSGYDKIDKRQADLEDHKWRLKRKQERSLS